MSTRQVSAAKCLRIKSLAVGGSSDRHPPFAWHVEG